MTPEPDCLTFRLLSQIILVKLLVQEGELFCFSNTLF